MTISNNFVLKTLQILFYLFPLSFALGNLMINSMVLLMVILGIIHFKKDLFKFQNKYLLLTIILFFLMVIFASYYKYFLVDPNKDAIKSILYLRYLFFLLIIKALIINNHIKINYFLNICFLLSFFVSLDIVIQSLIGQNILGKDIVLLIPPGVNPGYPEGLKYHTGIFGKELIAGGFILMFSTVGIFAIFNFLKIKNKILYVLIFFLLSIFFLGALILAGNRMPILLFILFIFLFALIYKKKEKIYFFSSALIIFALLSYTILNTESLLKRIGNFKAGIPSPIVIIDELKKSYPNLKKYENSGIQFHNLEEFKTTENYQNYSFFTGHLPIYITSIDLFFDKPFIGGGIKSFRNNCVNLIHLPNRVCENHPHNFILEILNDTGVIGFALIISFVCYLLINNYRDYRRGNPEILKMSNWVYLAIILSISIHFFPIKSSGSFFSTFNSSFIFLILGISLGLNDLKFKKLIK